VRRRKAAVSASAGFGHCTANVARIGTCHGTDQPEKARRENSLLVALRQGSLTAIKGALAPGSRVKFRPGRRWRGEIARGIAESNLVVLFWCRHALTAASVRGVACGDRATEGPAAAAARRDAAVEAVERVPVHRLPGHGQRQPQPGSSAQATPREAAEDALQALQRRSISVPLRPATRPAPCLFQ